MTGTALAKPRKFELAQLTELDIIKESLAPGEELEAADFQIARVAPGGTLAFAVGEDDVEKELTGVILLRQITRAYWSDKYGTGDKAPNCSSLDGITGIGDPGGSCKVCPFNQWGSAVDDNGNPAKGKACREITRLLFVQEGNVLPLMVTAPPTSLKPLRRYVVGFAVRKPQSRYHEHVTRLSIEKAANADGIDYGVVRAEHIAPLDEESKDNIAMLTEMLKEAFLTADVESDYDASATGESEDDLPY